MHAHTDPLVGLSKITDMNERIALLKQAGVYKSPEECKEMASAIIARMVMREL